MKASEARQEFHGLNEEQLAMRLSDLKAELFTLRMQHATNQLKNPLQIRTTRRNIARVKTLLREKEAQASRSGAARQ